MLHPSHTHSAPRLRWNLPTGRAGTSFRNYRQMLEKTCIELSAVPGAFPGAGHADVALRSLRTGLQS